MRNLIKTVPVIAGAYLLSSYVAIPRSFPPPNPAPRPNFTFYEKNNLVHVTFTDGERETYRVKRSIYDYLLDRMTESDYDLLNKSLVMRDILETADVDDDYFIGNIDVFYIASSKVLRDRLTNLVNMHYPDDDPKLARR